MPASVIFLISDDASQTASNDNHIRLPQAFTDGNWTVHIGAPERLTLTPEGLTVDGFVLHKADLIWPLGFGSRAGFLDRAHLLRQLPQDKLISPIAEHVLGHGKAQWSEYCPPTYVSNDAAYLQRIAKEFGGDWVLKPLAGSYGRDVHHVQSNQSGIICDVMQEQPRSYFALQRFIAGIIEGEVRTLVAGGQIIGSYRRLPQNGIRANLSALGRAVPVRDQEIDTELIGKVHKDLQRRHIGYAAIDTVDRYLMEVNLVNPGGLGTLCTLYKRDFADHVVRAIAAQRSL